MLRSEGADVAVVNISKDLNIGAVAARLGRVPVLNRIGLLEDFKDSGEERLWHRWLVDQTIVPSEYLRDQLVGELVWFDRTRISVIPNSKPIRESEPGTREKNSRFTFGVTSQLSPSKGHAYLLAAAERLRSEGVDLRVRIAGVGPLDKELRAETERRRLTGIVEFCGFQKDVPAFLSGLDAYVLPSLKESFSNAVLEAMACGLPVIAFRAGGVPEVVGEAGILTPPRDVGALAREMGRLACDPKLCLRLGRAARDRVVEKFDIATNVLSLESLLGRVTAPPGSAAGAS
jgi:glycosyltransferase involved in cell wall biosynthesis